jgi:hypothetical protein
VARNPRLSAVGKQKAQAFQAGASEILGFVAIDRSNAAFAVWVLRNHLNLRRTISHAASSHFVCFENRLTSLRSSIPDYSSAGKCLVLRNYTPRRLILGCLNGCCALKPAEKPKPATRPQRSFADRCLSDRSGNHTRRWLASPANGSFRLPPMSARCPNRPSRFPDSCRSAKLGIFVLGCSEADIGDLTLPATCRQSWLRFNFCCWSAR